MFGLFSRKPQKLTADSGNKVTSISIGEGTERAFCEVMKRETELQRGLTAIVKGQAADRANASRERQLRIKADGAETVARLKLAQENAKLLQTAIKSGRFNLNSRDGAALVSQLIAAGQQFYR